jgi:phosphatidate cytidylyltransferase
LTFRPSLGADFATRLLTAAIGGTLIIAILAIGGFYTNLLAAVVGGVASIELWHIFYPTNRLGLITALMVTVTAVVSVITAQPPIVLLAIALALLLGIIDSARQPEAHIAFFLRHHVYAILGSLYVGLPLGIFAIVRTFDHGFYWTGLVFTNSWCTDGFALIGGRLAGRHKLAPQISPGKTIEGALIGIAVGTLGGLFLMGILRLTPTPQIDWGIAILLNIALAMVNMLGDLFESWLKRRFHVKHTSQLLPGHGGFLDRLDGLLFAFPALYCFLLLLR